MLFHQFPVKATARRNIRTGKDDMDEGNQPEATALDDECSL